MGMMHVQATLMDVRKKGGRKGKPSPGAELVRRRWRKATEAEKKEVGRQLAESRRRARLKRELLAKQKPE